MPFYQNPFDAEFRGHWMVGGDLRAAITFPIAAHRGRGDTWQTAVGGPYDLSASPVLTLNYAYDTAFRNYSALPVNVAGAVPAATTADEIVATLRGNVTFSDLFTAEVRLVAGNPGLLVKNKRAKISMRVYFSNTGAEKVFRFNKTAGVAELPSYFDRHTIANRFAFPDGDAMLVRLDETDAVIDQAIITDGGFVPGNMKADWALLKGRSGNFNFQKMTVDGSDRTTQVVEYPAGAQAGDLARKTVYVYSGGNKNPSQVTQVPYLLTAGDLLTP